MWRTPLTCHFSEVLQWSLWTRSIDQTGTRNVLYSQEQISRSVIILAILGSYWATFYYQGSCHIYSSYSRNFSDSNHFKLQREFRPSNEIFLQNWPRYLKVGTHGVGELSFFHDWFFLFYWKELFHDQYVIGTWKQSNFEWNKSLGYVPSCGTTFLTSPLYFSRAVPSCV